jgi:serine/threonine-protein kinase
MKAIANANLKVGKIVPENTSNVVGKVIKQEPQAQTKVKEDTPINVYFEASTQITTQRRIMTERVNLTNSQSYPERFRVRVEIIPSDTNRLEVIMDEIKSKGDFPLTLLIPIPDNGSSRVRMFLNNSSTPYVEFSKP